MWLFDSRFFFSFQMQLYFLGNIIYLRIRPPALQFVSSRSSFTCIFSLSSKFVSWFSTLQIFSYHFYSLPLVQHYLIIYKGSNSTKTVQQSEQDSVYFIWIINDPGRVRLVYLYSYIV